MAEDFFRVRKGIIVANTSASANLDPTQLRIGSTTVNGAGVFAATVNAATLTGITTLPTLTAISATQSFNVGALFTANTTLVNAAAINVTGQINAASMFLSGQANVTTLNVTTSANVGANVQVTTTSLSIGNTSVNTFANSSYLRIKSLSVNNSLGVAGQAILSNGSVNYYGDVEIQGRSKTHQYVAADYTLTLADAGKTVMVDGTWWVSINTDAAVGWLPDTYINILALNGTPGVRGINGVALGSRYGVHLAGQYSMATIIKVDVNWWALGGDIVP